MSGPWERDYDQVVPGNPPIGQLKLVYENTSGPGRRCPDLALEPLLQELITASPDQLNMMWEHVTGMLPLPIQRRIMHVLIRAMGHSNPELRQRASRVLQVIGPPVIPLLEAYLHSTPKTAFCVALIDTLAAIGVTLEYRYHAQMLFTFMIMTNTTSDVAIRTACANAVAKLRHAEQGGEAGR